MHAPPLSWRLKKQKYKLLGSKCGCGIVYYPQRKTCKNCGNVTTKTTCSENGTIISFTQIKVHPEGFEKHKPYVVGLIKLKDGPVISAHIIGPIDKIKINVPVKAVFRSLSKTSDSVINYTTKFEIVN
jgi:uncharacterized protein